MGIRAVPKAWWIKFLKAQGLVYIRTKNHELWNTPPGQPDLSRNITFQMKGKTVPRTHIHTNLITLGITHDEFDAIFKMKKPRHVNCLRESLKKVTPQSNLK